MKVHEIISKLKTLDEIGYYGDETLDEYYDNQEEDLDNFSISYILDLRDLDNSLNKAYKKIESVFVGYYCSHYVRIEEIEDGFLCVQIFLKKNYNV